MDFASRSLLLPVLAICVLVACKSTPDQADSGSGGRPGGSGLEACDRGCDDGFDCTVDQCVAGTCEHSIGPNSGATQCPAGRYCTVERGCISAPACATDDDCVDAFDGDACKDAPRCDPESSVCIFDPLDKDGDGHAPQVCGGNDCNDDNADVHPGPKLLLDESGVYEEGDEACNGRDDDCDGVADEEVSCGGVLQCVEGACTCPRDKACGDECVDKATDPRHCGACNTTCGEFEVCQDGECVCDSDSYLQDERGMGAAPSLKLQACDGICIDVSKDPLNCGDCGHECGSLERCRGGACECRANTMTNAENCGACGNVCPCGAGCEAGMCVCSEGATLCGDTCRDLNSDEHNCGGCDNECAQLELCYSGQCRCLADINTDSTSCGACGNACAEGHYCESGTCVELPRVAADENLILNGDFSDGARYWTARDSRGALDGTLKNGAFCLVSDLAPRNENIDTAWTLFVTWEAEESLRVPVDTTTCLEVSYRAWTSNADKVSVSLWHENLMFSGGYVTPTPTSHVRRFVPFGEGLSGIGISVIRQTNAQADDVLGKCVVTEHSEIELCIDDVVLRVVDAALCP